MKDFIVALSFLTLIPIKVNNYENVHRSFRFFPLVGAIIGGISYLFYACFLYFLPKYLSVVLSIFLYHVINGGLHIDGFADLFDAFFGAKKNRDRFKEILKDSRVGVMGVFGLIFYFSVIFAAILDVELDLSFFVAFGLFGRLVIVIVTYLSKPLFDDGLGSFFVKRVSIYEFSTALISAFIVLLFLGKVYIFFLFIILFWGYLFRKFSNHFLGGVSGDILGAGCIFSEMLFVLLWRAFL
jgi:adenosylcobinamide-GDP ribazoletransferase